MQTVLFAGYPKSGNTLIGEVMQIAGGLAQPGWQSPGFDIYDLRRLRVMPSANPALPGNRVCIKTHGNFRRTIDLERSFFGPVTAILPIVRNPFDTLLSALNHLRFSFVRHSGNLPRESLETLKQLLPNYIYNPETFVSQFTIDNLRQQGHLDGALANFAALGTVIPSFYAMSGPWVLFSDSWSMSDRSLLRLNYEDLAASENSPEKQRLCVELAALIDCNQQILHRAFIAQAEVCKQRQEAGSIFFPRLVLVTTSLIFRCKLAETSLTNTLHRWFEWGTRICLIPCLAPQIKIAIRDGFMAGVFTNIRHVNDWLLFFCVPRLLQLNRKSAAHVDDVQGMRDFRLVTRIRVVRLSIKSCLKNFGYVNSVDEFGAATVVRMYMNKIKQLMEFCHHWQKLHVKEAALA